MRFSRLLAGADGDNEVVALEDLLADYEKERPQIKERVVNSAAKHEFGEHDLTRMFDGACMRRKCARSLGAYGFVVFNSEGNEVFSRAG